MKFKKLATINMKDFTLKWRWTDPNYCLMPEVDLEKIIPLDEKSSKAVWKQSLLFADNSSEFKPLEDIFPNIQSTEEQDEEIIRKWLREKILTNCKIIVSWQPDLGVITDTDTFIKYWDDFCYPSSDDVSIWPKDEAWVLHYWHEEKFWFGNK